MASNHAYMHKKLTYYIEKYFLNYFKLMTLYILKN